MKDTQELTNVEVMPPNALEAITRGEIDMQIATAHQYPRSMAKFKQRALEMVSTDEDTASSCIYRRPVGKKKNEKTGRWEEEFAEGMSVRMAEIGAACYGNIRVGSMLVEQTERMVRCRGMCHDLENNVAASSECIESTVTKEGKPYSEGMRTVIAKSCLAKAGRDAFFKVVPRAIFKAIEEQARKVAIGDASTLGARRRKILDWLNKLAVDPKRVWQALGITGPDDIGLEQAETLTGIRTAIKDKEVTVDEAFPPLREHSGKNPFKGDTATETPDKDAAAMQAAETTVEASEGLWSGNETGGQP